MISYDYFLEELDDNTQAIIEFVNNEFLSFPDIHRKIRYNIPFYFYHSWLCYLNPIKKKTGIELCFLNGHALTNNHGLLDRKNRKMVSGITIENIESIPVEAIIESFCEAMVLDKEISKNKKK